MAAAPPDNTAPLPRPLPPTRLPPPPAPQKQEQDLKRILQTFEQEVRTTPKTLTEPGGAQWSQILSENCQYIMQLTERIQRGLARGENPDLQTISQLLGQINQSFAKITDAEKFKLLVDYSKKTEEQLNNAIQWTKGEEEYRVKYQELLAEVQKLRTLNPTSEDFSLTPYHNVERLLSEVLNLGLRISDKRFEQYHPLFIQQIQRDLQPLQEFNLLEGHFHEAIALRKKISEDATNDFLALSQPIPLEKLLENYEKMKRASESTNQLLSQMEVIYNGSNQITSQGSSLVTKLNQPDLLNDVFSLTHLCQDLRKTSQPLTIIAQSKMVSANLHFLRTIAHKDPEGNEFIKELERRIDIYAKNPRAISRQELNELQIHVKTIADLADASHIKQPRGVLFVNGSCIDRLDQLKKRSQETLDLYLHPEKIGAQKFESLVSAIRENRPNELRELLKDGDPNAKDAQGHTLLEEALMSGKSEAIEILLAAGADPETEWEGEIAGWWALQTGRPDLIQPFLDHRLDIDMQNSYGRTSLSYAVEEGDLERMKTLHSLGATLDSEDSTGNTPIHVASAFGQEEAFVLLKGWGASINMRNMVNGNTPLHSAAGHGQIDIITILLEFGADVNKENKGDQTPLFFAIRTHNQAIANLLISAGAIIDHRDSEGRTPLWHACSKNLGDLIATFLKKGANPEILDNNNQSPFSQYTGEKDLFKTIHEGRAEWLKILLRHFKLDPNTKTPDGKSALELALEKGQPALVRALLEAGADINIEVRGEKLFWHVLDSRNPEMIRIFQERGAEINMRNNRMNETKMHIATQEGNIPLLRALRELGANFEEPDSMGDTPFLTAVRGNNLRMARDLQNLDANIDAQNRLDGRTALHYAVTRGDLAALTELLEMGADPNIQDAEGRSPLHLAIIEGKNQNIIRELLANRANPLLLDRIGATPLHHAVLQNNGMFIRRMRDAINEPDEKGRTPLSLACEMGNRKMMVALLNEGANPKIGDQAGVKPLTKFKGNTDPIKAIQEKDVDWLGITLKYFKKDPNFRIGNKSLIEHVIDQNSEEMLRVLIDNNVNLTSRNPDGRNALHYAVGTNKPQMVKALFDATESMYSENQREFYTARDAAGKTPLSIACDRGDKEMVQLFYKAKIEAPYQEVFQGNTDIFQAIREGNTDWLETLMYYFDINPNKLRSAEGNSPLRFAFETHRYKEAALLVQNAPWYNPQERWNGEEPFWWVLQTGDRELIKAFMKKRASINMQNSAGETALTDVAMRGDLNLISILVELGADINSSNRVGDTPVHTAVLHDNVASIRHLKGLGADINRPNPRTLKTPLHVATILKKSNSMKTLIEIGANVNAQDKEGDTPLHLTATKNDIPSAEILINFGHANPNLQNKENRTPYWISTWEGYKDMATFLEKNGANPRISDKKATPNLLIMMQRPKEIHKLAQDALLHQELSLKVLSHVFEIAGQAKVEGEEIRLEGGYQTFFSQQILEALRTFDHEYSDIIPQRDLEFIYPLLLRGINPSYKTPTATFFKEYKEGLPIQIHSGYDKHAVEIIMWGNRLVISNRGAYGRKPIEVLKIIPEKVTPALIKEIIDLKEKKDKDYVSWLNTFEAKFGAEHDPIGEMIEKAFPIPGMQIVGNCAFSSPVSALYPLLALLRLRKEQDPKPEHLVPVAKTFLRVYQFIQVFALDKYIRKLAPGELPNLSAKELLPVLRQSVLVPFCPPTIKERIEAFIGQYMGSLNPQDRTSLKVDQLYAKLMLKEYPAAPQVAASAAAPPVDQANLAIAGGDPDWLRTLLGREQITIDSKGSDGEPLFHKALMKGDRALIQAFLSANGDINTKFNGQTALMSLVRNKNANKEQIQLLLDLRADPNVASDNGSFPLLAAAKRPETDVLVLLLNNRANLNLQIPPANQTALHEAISANNINGVRVLLDRQASLELKDDKGRTAYDLACETGNEEIIRLLWEAGGRRGNWLGDKLETRTTLAWGKIVKELNQGLAGPQADETEARVQARFVRFLTAILAEYHVEDINQLGFDGKNLLHQAVKLNNTRLTRTLLTLGAKPEIVSTQGTSALHWVASNGNIDLLDALIQRNAPVDALDKMNRTPLHYATINGFAQVVDRFIKAGAKTNTVDLPLPEEVQAAEAAAQAAKRPPTPVQGKTPLQWAQKQIMKAKGNKQQDFRDIIRMLTDESPPKSARSLS